MMIEMIDVEKFRAQLIEHEGLRLKPYWDTARPPKLTIGIGRNLEDRGISRTEAFFLFENDVAQVVQELDRHFPWWRQLDEVRQRVLADMCFNLGIFRLMNFPHMLAGLAAHDFEKAANEMVDSTWFRQVGIRSRRLVQMMRTGKDVPLKEVE